MVAAIVALSAANAVGVLLRHEGHDLWNLVPLTDVNHEQSVPTWFAALLMAAVAVLLVVVSWDPPEGTTRRRWLFLAVLAAALSADDVAAYHESWVEPVRDQLDDPSGFLLQAWVIPATVLVAVVGLSQLRLLRRLPRDTARGLVVGTGLFLLGAVVLEMVGAKYGEDWGTNTKRYDAIVAVEEAAEMLGAAVVVRTLLAHIGSRGRPLLLTVPPTPSGVGAAPTPRPSGRRT